MHKLGLDTSPRNYQFPTCPARWQVDSEEKNDFM